MNGNYRTKIAQLIAAGQLKAEAGTIVPIAVYHDQWCAIYKGTGCTCDPDIGPGPRAA